MPFPYIEDTLIQRTTAAYLNRRLGWGSVYAHYGDDFCPGGVLGWASDRDGVLTRALRERLAALKPDPTHEAYDDGVRRVTVTTVSPAIVATNRDKYDLTHDGLQATYRDAEGQPTRRRLGVVDFDGTRAAVVVSEERGEAFKEPEHPFRIVVCAMWLTDFDVPSLSTLYLDKPLKAHTLMQAIARANRVNEGKNNGLIVDYCGVLKHLRGALATSPALSQRAAAARPTRRGPTRSFSTTSSRRSQW